MLAEFKYGLEPKETFSSILGDQVKPRRSAFLLAYFIVILTRQPIQTFLPFQEGMYQ